MPSLLPTGSSNFTPTQYPSPKLAPPPDDDDDDTDESLLDDDEDAAPDDDDGTIDGHAGDSPTHMILPLLLPG